MGVYSTQEKVKIVEFYLATRSITLTQRKFRTHFKVKIAPTRNSILNIIEKFSNDGSVENRYHGATGTTRTVRTQALIEKAKVIMEEDPRTPLRHLSQQAGVSYSTARRVLIEDLGLYPYKMWTRQKLTPKNMTDRVEFCRWFLRQCEMTDAFLQHIWFTDEAHFYLDGSVNTQNNRFWATTAPDIVKERPLHSLKCTAWCAVSSSGVIDPFWSEDGQGRTQTERYRRIFRRFVTVMQRRCADTHAIQWFQQDGATPHTAHETTKLIQECFGTRVISRNTPHPWPAISPDLNPPDFFLWGYLKSLVYKWNPQTLAELKKAICAAVRAIPSHTCQIAVENLCKRAELCVARNGRHLEHVL